MLEIETINKSLWTVKNWPLFNVPFKGWMGGEWEEAFDWTVSHKCQSTFLQLLISSESYFELF